MADDRLFWLAIYRAIMAIAAAVKRFKIDGCNEPVEDGKILSMIDPTNRG
jgi:hypothetical protein